MQSFTVVIAHSDSVAAQQLSNGLQAHFRHVAVASTLETLREEIAKNRAQLAVVDLDMVSVDGIRELCAEYHATGVVCVHRAPDFEIWNSAVDAGALECCHPTDIPAILNAIRSRGMVSTHAAAA